MGTIFGSGNEGLRDVAGNVDDGLQVGEGGGASLAEDQRLGDVGQGRDRREIHRRRHGESGLTMGQRDALKDFSYNRLDNISQAS